MSSNFSLSSLASAVATYVDGVYQAFPFAGIQIINAVESIEVLKGPQGTLYGNPCFKEVSHEFHFEYLVAPKGIKPNRNNFSRDFHNLGVNIILFFRNGPFWKARMKKKFQQCKYGYGDFVG